MNDASLSFVSQWIRAAKTKVLRSQKKFSHAAAQPRSVFIAPLRRRV
jgi:hypothetical protein